MGIEVRTRSNGDEAVIVWRTSERIPGCRGFAVERDGRRPDGSSEVLTLDTFVGFANETPAPPPGTHRSSAEWPIQRFIWHDYHANAYDAVRYRVIPMLGTAGNLQPDPAAASDWSDWTTVATGQSAGFRSFFNRGIVATQWLGRRLAVPASQERTKLGEVIADPSSPIRQFLGGWDRIQLVTMLDEAKANGSVVYAALYELNDPELIPRALALGGRLNLLLASGAFQPGEPDENAAVRAQLKAAGTVHVFDRLVRGPHFAHNKFMVICDPAGTPQKVWTGSTNWTMTGLCTQANNGLLIDSPELAAGYLAYWNRLRDAGGSYPPTLRTTNDTPLRTTVGGSAVTAWLTPVGNAIDLADARAHIQAATQGVLFLMFIPGPKGTLLNDILGLDAENLFVHGVINQDPGGAKHPLVTLVNRGQSLPADRNVIVPAAINTSLEYWQPELKQYSLAMIHSKVVIVDPFGAHPVVMTGSHNLGPKASGQNDDNLVIIEDAPGLAAEYAVNIMGIYGQYKWRYNMLTAASDGKAPEGAWTGLVDDDTWQDEFFGGAKLRELRFWFGESTADPAAMQPVPVLAAQPTAPG